MPSRAISGAAPEDPGNKFAEAILNFIGHLPETHEHQSLDPAGRAKAVASAAARKAAVTAGTLALPPGPLGWLTILPELIAVWKIQAQVIADIAAIYGKQSTLTREQMIYCLFRHVAAQAVRDLIVQVGERFLVRRAFLRVLQTVARKTGVRITQRAVGKGFSRWLPVAGAAGVAAFAYYDTARVATTAIALFAHEIDIETDPQ